MSKTLTDPLIGRLVDGRYEVRERVADGGMATVYLAFDKRLERNIALKVMHASLAEGVDAKEFVSRFRREAKAAARLTHPGAVRVYDQGVDNDISYLTMEFVDGENLRERIGHEGTLTVGEALTITESVLDALAAAHRQGLVHRDVKPENVLIDAEGRPRVADFGLARAVTEVTSTSTGVIMGTVAYLGPELVTRGFSDARTDIYAVGVLLFEMVTGRQPFTAASAIDVAARHVHEDIPAPSGYAPWLPTEFDDLVASLAARDPESRPADATAALGMVRSTRALMDDPTLDRRADPPSGSIALADADADPDATTILDTVQSGATVALPIGTGRIFPAVELFEAELDDGDPEAEEPETSQHRVWWWLGAILAVAVFLGGATLWWYNAVGPGAYTTLPPVEATNGQDAQKVLESKGFVVVVNHDYSDSVPAGVVISSNPKGQARVENGATVTLLVSLGVEQAKVPQVVGSTEGEAKSALTDAGFPVGDSVLTYSDTIPQGQVMSSTPVAGQTVDHNTTVVLEVSNGPAPIKVPDVSGMTEAEARAAFEPFALVVTVQHERTPDTPKGEVFKQDPAANADGLRAQDVTIWISDGPPLVTVDDYVGMKVKDAQKAAETAGLKVSLYGKWPWSTKKSIVDQSPFPGTQVEQGSTITLTYN